MLFSEVSVAWAITILFSCTLLLYLSAYAFQRQQVYGAREFAFFMLFVSFYSLAYALEMNASTESKIMDILKFEVFCASFTAPAFFLFVIRFIRGKDHSHHKGLLLFIIPVIIGLFAFTNDRHQFMYKSYSIIEGSYFPIIHYEAGIVYQIQLFFLISMSLSAEIILLIHFFKSRGYVRKQTILIVVAGVLPTVSAMINPGRSTFDGLDTQPFAFLISGLLLALALFRFKMFDLVSIAREYAVDTIHDYLIILDRNLLIVDINEAGRKSSLLKSVKKGFPLRPDNPLASRLIRQIHDSSQTGVDREYLFQQEDRHFKFSISIIQNNMDDIEGYVILIHENTTITLLMKELEGLAFKDDLTGILNRRHFVDLTNREIEIARRNGGSLSMIIFDLDNFKQVNDQYGHLTGDRVLKGMAQAVGKELRVSELFARYGGEEFCILCPNTNKEESRLFAERLRTEISSLRWTEEGKTISITASFGLFSTSRLHNRNVHYLFSKADTALYTAKHEGKNCVRVEEESSAVYSQGEESITI